MLLIKHNACKRKINVCITSKDENHEPYFRIMYFVENTN